MLTAGTYSSSTNEIVLLVPLRLTVNVTVSPTSAFSSAEVMSDDEETSVSFTFVTRSPLVTPAFSAFEPESTERT